VEHLRISQERTVGGTVVGFLEWFDSTHTYRLCSSRAFVDNHTATLLCKHSGYDGGGARINPISLLLASAKKEMGNLLMFSCKANATSLDQCTSGELAKNPACDQAETVAVKCYGECST
jgi:hypothetical protein